MYNGILYADESIMNEGKSKQKRDIMAMIDESQTPQEITETLNFSSTLRRKLSLRSADIIHHESSPKMSTYSNRRVPEIDQLRISIPCYSEQLIESTQHGRIVLQTPIDTPCSVNYIDAKLIALSCSPVKKILRESSLSFKAPSFHATPSFHTTPYYSSIIDQNCAQISEQKFIPAREKNSFKAPPLNFFLFQPAEINTLLDRKSLDIFGDSSTPFKSLSVKSSTEPPVCKISTMNQVTSLTSIQNLLSGYSSFKRLCLKRDCRHQSLEKSENKDNEKEKEKDIFDRLSYSYGYNFDNLVYPSYEIGLKSRIENNIHQESIGFVCSVTGVSPDVSDDGTCSDLSQDEMKSSLGPRSEVKIKFKFNVSEKNLKKMNRIGVKKIEKIHQIIIKQNVRRSARLLQ